MTPLPLGFGVWNWAFWLLHIYCAVWHFDNKFAQWNYTGFEKTVWIESFAAWIGAVFFSRIETGLFHKTAMATLYFLDTWSTTGWKTTGSDWTFMARHCCCCFLFNDLLCEQTYSLILFLIQWKQCSCKIVFSFEHYWSIEYCTNF